jgi:group I intron endonuclease
MANLKLHTGIYMILNIENGRYYIGSAMRFNKRWKEHLRGLENNRHHSKFMQRDWNKCGAEFFKFIKLVICEAKDLIAIEQKCMDSMKPVYNSAPTAGSQLGFKFSDESKLKMSEAAKRTRNFTGHKHSEETRAKISSTKTGVKMGPYSKERCAKLSESQKGRVISPEHRAKISATLTGRKQSVDTIAKRSKKLREVLPRARAVLSESKVKEVMMLVKNKIKHSEIEIITGVKRYTIADIACGRKYKWVNYE